jgi:H+/Cl- antiporter ClcA
MKMCGHCGSGNDDNSRFCIHCGAPLAAQSGSDDKRGPQEEIIYTDVAPRSIPISIILSFVTCGIYMLYWIYRLNDEINELAQDETAPGGGLVIILTALTCGIYGLYWYYRMGEKCDYIAQTHTSNNILYLVLGIFGLGIVSIALMQDTVNRVLE